MQELTIKPSMVGQICKAVNNLNDEDPNDVYIICEDPAPFDENDNIYVANLKDIQKNIRNPHNTPKIQILKGNLKVVGNDLEAYIKSWNK